MVTDDQGSTSIDLRKDDGETEGPLCTLGDDASANDATLDIRISLDAKDASSFGESSPQLENLVISIEDFIREASRQVQKYYSTIDIIGDPEA